MELNFNLAQVEDLAPIGSGPLPKGTYYFQVEQQEEQELANGAGVKYTFLVIKNGQPEQGRKLWQTFILNHTTPLAQNIGRAQLKALSLACTNMAVSNTGQLVGKFFMGVVDHREYTSKTGEKKVQAQVVKFMPPTDYRTAEALKVDVNSDDIPF